MNLQPIATLLVQGACAVRRGAFRDAKVRNPWTVVSHGKVIWSSPRGPVVNDGFFN